MKLQDIEGGQQMGTLITTKQLEQKLSVTAVTIWRWRNEGMPFLKLNNSIRFEEEKVLKWLKDKGKDE